MASDEVPCQRPAPEVQAYRPPVIERSTTEEGHIVHTLSSRRHLHKTSMLHPSRAKDKRLNLLDQTRAEGSRSREDSDDETVEDCTEEDRTESSSDQRLARKVWRGLKKDRIVDGTNGEDAAVHMFVKPQNATTSQDAFDLMGCEESERQRAAREMRKMREDVHAEYVWDVLFENQRGILLYGRPFFSSASLMPFDPSAFTVPSRPLPSATSSFSVANPHNPTQATRVVSSRAAGKRTAKAPSHRHDEALLRNRPTKTAYTPATYQTPSPAWTYLTPWLINMRSDGETDELGWEYNYLFRTKGWHSRIGRLGWGGWVRRRGWVRLRSRILPDSRSAEHDGDPTDTHAAVTEELEIKAEEAENANQSHMPTPEESEEREHATLPSAEDVFSHERETVGAILQDIRKAAIPLTLDRQKLALCAKWLEEAKHSDVVRKKLELVCGVDASEEVYHDIEQLFVYTQSRRALADLLESAGFGRRPDRGAKPLQTPAES